MLVLLSNLQLKVSHPWSGQAKFQAQAELHEAVSQKTNKK